MNKRILVADDDYYIRKLMIEILDKENYEIVTAIDGNDALRYLIRNTLDLAILDYHLPGVNSDEILKSLQERCIDLPVIVITADDSIETERIIRSFGPAYLFIKPFNVNDMGKVVKKIFTRKKRHYTEISI